MVTVFLWILNQIEFNLVHNRKGNCHHDLIPFNVKGIGSIVFSVYMDIYVSHIVDNNYFHLLQKSVDCHAIITGLLFSKLQVN